MLVDKPPGPTSHDIVDQLRKITGIKKIGHAGTLDPFASGLLIMAIGREATRKISAFVKLDKEYEAQIILGAESDTHDRTGRKLEAGGKKCGLAEIKKAVKQFIGKQEQLPPMYSAKKIGGKKLYRLARKGISVERQPVEIFIHVLEILSYNWPYLRIKVRCSSGTYIRALARDLGRLLQTGAYLSELKRTAIGKYPVTKAAAVSKINEKNWRGFLF